MVKLGVVLLVLVALLGIAGWAYLQQPKFGPSLGAIRNGRVLASPNYVKGAFRNQLPTPLFSDDSTFFSVLRANLTEAKPDGLRPPAPVPAVKTELRSLDPAQDWVVWLGHSSFFVQIAGRRILIDPVFSTYAAPFPFVNKAFDGATPYSAADMPEIDVLLITHSHWDHLDYDSITALEPKTKRAVVPLGIGAYLAQWGYAEAKITEADWNDSVEISSGLGIHALPARHYTRRLMETNQTLWLSFAITSPSHRLFFSGDSGYGPHFAEIGAKFGGFDLVALDSGQYNRRWPHIHMNPEEAAQAAQDLGARALLPAHVGKFAISKHSWDEPLERVAAATVGHPYELVTPIIGQPLALSALPAPLPRWWRSATQQESPAMKITMNVDGTVLPITLGNSKTAQDFAALLPLTLMLDDYGKVEKISDLPKKLSTADAPRGMAPAIGDVTYYAPWGNLAIFTGDFRYSDGLVKLGRIETGIESLKKRGPLKATLQLATE